MTATLGISCFYHDAAAALVIDGQVVAAAQEERFSRKKHDPSFPLSAISYCLEEADLSSGDLDSVVFYDKPVLTFHRLMRTYLGVAPRGLKSWLHAVPRWISQKLHIPRIISESLEYSGPVLFTPHHISHAASAYLPSPYEDAAILTIDGVGEWATASYGVGEGKQVTVLEEMHFPDSLGLLYSAFTYFTGFRVNSGEYKLMGLAPYGEPRYLQAIKDHIASIAEDGTVTLNLDYFGFLDSMAMTSHRFEQVFDGPRRLPETQITRREMDIAKSIQVFTEEAVLKMAAHVHAQTGKKNLCLAGGVALNCVANGKLVAQGPFDDIWIQPAAGDAGAALGAALAVQYGYHDLERPPSGALDRQRGSYLGPAFAPQEIKAFLDSNGYPYQELASEKQADTVAGVMAQGNIVGFFAGRMEFGPRALGARSIIGDPRSEDTQRVMNLKIKYRESFRPFAPSVLAEDIGEFFDLDKPSPYMLLVAPVCAERHTPAQALATGEDMLAIVNQKRSDVPAITHVDYSARVQSVHQETNPLYHRVIESFKKLTGYGVIVNTSFNVRGEPIVCTPEEAYRCFMRTEMDYLFLDGFWLDKKQQPELGDDVDWRQEFELD